MVCMNLPIRHALATLAYRLGKVLRGTPADFRDFQAAPSVRTPGQILAHLSGNRVGGEPYDKEWPERAKRSMW